MGSCHYQSPDVYHEAANTANVSIDEYRIGGFVSPMGITNFLGIPYAEVPGRFRQARLIDPSQLRGVHDGRRYGPRCPQPTDVPRTWRAHLYQGIQQSDSLPVSEFECLNLNIYAPTEVPTRPLPVFVWIHGGGFVVGDGGPEYGKLFPPQSFKTFKAVTDFGRWKLSSQKLNRIGETVRLRCDELSTWILWFSCLEATQGRGHSGR
jgi:hypothetical protein